MYHNAFRQYVRWHGGMIEAPDDEAAAPAAAQEQEEQEDPPQELFDYNDEQLALPQAATAYQKYCSDWSEWNNFAVPGGGEEVVPNGEEIEWHDRFPHNRAYENASWYLLHRGIKVRTQVDLSFLFGHENPLLVIQVDKQPDWDESSFISHRTSNSLLHRHVSIGPMKKIKELIPDWNNKLERLYLKFHDRDLWLWAKRISSGATFELSTYDPIASDPIVQEFNTTNIKWNEHDGEWVPNVPDLHISL